MNTQIILNRESATLSLKALRFLKADLTNRLTEPNLTTKDVDNMWDQLEKITNLIKELKSLLEE
jgi:hypothetical protein